MALTNLQREICRLLAAHRIAHGEAYLAGGATLNEILGAARLSRDIDVFHDTAAALEASWFGDRALLLAGGFDVAVVRERSSFVEAEVGRGGERVLMQWARDSAFRFFPLLEDPDLGLVLHPVDLATNKVLALVGRLEVRDWVDVIESCQRVQHLGLLAWAASGKDPGFSPSGILEQAGRSARYSEEEVRQLSYETDPPSAADLSKRWHAILGEARSMVGLLPAEQVGTCVLHRSGALFQGGRESLARALEEGELVYHRGRIQGALPTPIG